MLDWVLGVAAWGTSYAELTNEAGLVTDSGIDFLSDEQQCGVVWQGDRYGKTSPNG
jgi:hypothetical protein